MPWQFCTVLVSQLQCHMAPIQKSHLNQVKYFVFHNQTFNLILNFLLIGQLFIFRKNTYHNIPSPCFKVLNK